MTGFYTFKWDHPANEVYVTGTFDGWSRSTKLDKAGEIFVKKVELPVENILYKFVVDGNWVTDPNAPLETEESGVQNNVLFSTVIAETEKEKAMEAATINSVAPESTTAALAAEASKEPDTVAISSVAPESTTTSLAGGVPVEQLTPSAGDLPGGFPETPAAEMTDPTPVVAGEQEQVFFVKPLPASETAENPITLQPGEAVPQIGTESVHSHVKLDKESYEKGATNYPIETKEAADVPKVVRESQDIASVAPEASASADVAEKKAAVESELKTEVIETPAIAECNTAAEQAAEIAGEAAEQATVIASQVSEQAKNAAAIAAPVLATAVASVANATDLAAGPVEKPASPVPEVVKQSIAEAGAPAEATANGELVEAKQDVETELKQEVVPSLPITEGPKEETAAVVAAEPSPAPAALVNAAKIPEQKAPVVTNGINSKTIMHHEITLNKPADVPEPVKHVTETHVSAEAASEPKSVERKEAVEEQLKENTPRKSTEATSSAKKSKRRSFFGAIFSKLPFVRS